jgi:ABC-type uncharacterized transport system permease subunit
MLSGVSITCFAASYTVALILEVTRLRFRSGIRGAVLLIFAGAGLIAHTVYLYNRAAGAARTPLSSEHDWYLVAAWVCVIGYILLTCHFKKAALGLFVLPLVLGLIAVATFLADRDPFARAPASLFWGIFHGTSILLATVTIFVGFLAAIMYLGLAHRLKRKLPPPRGLKLPSLEQLERTSRRTIVLAAVFMIFGVLSGLLLKAISAESSVPWHDPLILCTLITCAWLTTAAGLVVCYKPVRRGRAAAYLTMTTFAFLVISLAVGLMVDSQHGGTAVNGAAWPSGAQRHPNSFNPQPEAQAGSGVYDPFACASDCGSNEKCTHVESPIQPRSRPLVTPAPDFALDAALRLGGAL